MRDENVKYL
jgi:DNA-directed RNA polymerase subunit F